MRDDESENPTMPHRKYHSILDTHPDLICRYSPDFILSFVNRKFSELFNAPAESFIGQNLFDVVQETQREKLQERLALLSPQAPSVTISSNRTFENGDPIQLHWTIIALYNDAGELEEYQSLGRDVTKENRLNLALKERNQALETMQSEMRIVLDSMPCKVWYKDDKNTILKLNDVAAKSMGLDIDFVEGKNTYDLFGDSAKAYHDDDLAVINSGIPLMGRVERYTPNDGNAGWVQTDKIPFDHPVTGEKRILVVATDITELKEQEALLKSINKNLDDFAALTSHDLQAPLRHISIFAELLHSEYSDKLDTEAKSYIKQIRDGVESMRALIKSFLKFMRASPHGIELDLVDLTSVLEHIAKRHKLEFMTYGGTITLPKEQIYIRGDSTLLNQVIGNLVENSVKYRDHDRPLKIDISATKRAGQWHISVADNGVGIDDSSAAHVFDLFGRAKPHSDREGSGVGLALCKRIITLHGGEIALTRGREEGAEFVFSLNAAIPQE